MEGLTMSLQAPPEYDEKQKELFSQLNEHWQRIVLATHQPRISIDVAVDDAMKSTDSKIGGMPYIPAGGSYPVSKAGENLLLLIQINFAQVHEQVGQDKDFDILPKKGFLQIFVDTTSEEADLGLDGYAPTYPNDDRYRVKFIEDFDPSAPEFVPENIVIKELEVILSRAVKLSFRKSYDCAGFNTHVLECKRAIEKLGIEDTSLGENMDLVLGELTDYYSHQLLGIPIFAQQNEDAREENSEQILFLKIADDWGDGYYIAWCDGGMANFFMTPEQLAARDFSKLMYYWDSC